MAGAEISWKKGHIVILRFLFLKCYISSCKIEPEWLLRACFRTNEIGVGRQVLEELVRKKFVEKDNVSNVSLNKYYLPQVRRIIDDRKPATKLVQTQPSRDLIPDEYEKYPIFIATSDHASVGIAGSYYYHRKKDDEYEVMYIIVGTRNPTRKFLGSLRNPSSPLSQVYRIAKRKKKFFKADFNTADLPHSIVENRQPIKAAIDILEYFGLIRKTGRRRKKSEEYEITEVESPHSSLDDFDNKEGD